MKVLLGPTSRITRPAEYAWLVDNGYALCFEGMRHTWDMARALDAGVETYTMLTDITREGEIECGQYLASELAESVRPIFYGAPGEVGYAIAEVNVDTVLYAPVRTLREAWPMVNYLATVQLVGDRRLSVDMMGLYEPHPQNLYGWEEDQHLFTKISTDAYCYVADSYVPMWVGK